MEMLQHRNRLQPHWPLHCQSLVFLKFKDSRLAPDHDVATLRSDGTSLSIALPNVFLKFKESRLAPDHNVATLRSDATSSVIVFSKSKESSLAADDDVATSRSARQGSQEN
jgi:hypothetical protein